MLFAEEAGARINAGYRVEHAQARAAVPHTERLVETNMSVAADPQEHDVDAARRLDVRFILTAIRFHFFNRAGPIRNVDVFLRDVDVLEEMVLHPVAIALR